MMSAAYLGSTKGSGGSGDDGESNRAGASRKIGNILKGGEGRESFSDSRFDSLEEAVDQMVAEVQRRSLGARGTATSESADSPASVWLLEESALVLAGLGAELADLCRAYLRWSSVSSGGNVGGDSGDDSDGGDHIYNVTKAMRRLEQLGRWGHERREALADGGPITAAAVAHHMSLWGMVVSRRPAVRGSRHDGAVVLAVDMAAMDLDALAASSAAETQRLFFFLVHALSLDEAVQLHGLVVVEDFAGVKFSSARLFLRNPAIEDALRVLQGASAVRIKHFYFVHQPWWMAALTAAMKVGLGKKLRSRISTHRGWTAVFTLLGSRDVLPANLFACKSGTGPSVDRVFGQQLVNVQCSVEPNQ
jgi:hypothetical protein